MSNLGSNPVLGFAQEMQKKLDVNSFKGSWRAGHPGCTPEALLKRLKEETTEIEDALNSDKPVTVKDIIAECADVANFAMMIADNYKQK